MQERDVFEEAVDAIVAQDKTRAMDLARRALEEGIDPFELISKGFSVGISRVGDLFERGKIFLPELITASEVMKAVTDFLNSQVRGETEEKRGRVVIGTVEGDVHDIGKAIVVTLLQANGFEVFDVGRDCPIERFIEKAEEVEADVIGSSALLTTTMEGQKRLERELRRSGLREKYRTIVGGAPVTRRWAERIGADAYAENAAEAVHRVLELTNRKEG